MGVEDNNDRSERHVPTFDTNSLNRAVERASKEPNFINTAITLIKEMKFPAFKGDIVNYAKNKNVSNIDSDIIGLFESLDGYIEFRDMYHVQKSLEENNSEKKQTHQISDSTREQPQTQARSTSGSIKEKEVVNESEEKKKYPEVPPSAMSNFICDVCGKQFQNQNDLVQHQRFEGTNTTTNDE